MSLLPSSSSPGPEPASLAAPADARRLMRALLIASIVLAGIQAWANRYSVSPDGISYLDMAVAISQGRMGEAINGYWSPLYPSLVATAFAILRPSPVHESAVAHAVNFAIFVFTAACFRFFWASARATQFNPPGNSNRKAAGSEAGLYDLPRIPASAEHVLSDRAWWALGYGLFTWTSLALIGTGLIFAVFILVREYRRRRVHPALKAGEESEEEE